MIKKNIFTTIGIILSLAIAIFGYLFTSQLINAESNRLLSNTMTFSIPTIQTQEYYPDIGLSNDEIISILQNLKLREYMRPHEPAVGQISMGQAFTLARDALELLYIHDILPSETLEFEHAGAILTQNIVQGEEFLPLRYSYWTAHFRNDYVGINVTMNALTGQVLDMEVFVNQLQSAIQPFNFTISHDAIRNILSAFSGIATGLDVAIRVDDSMVTAYQHFADERIVAMITTSGTLLPYNMLLFNHFHIF